MGPDIISRSHNTFSLQSVLLKYLLNKNLMYINIKNVCRFEKGPWSRETAILCAMIYYSL